MAIHTDIASFPQKPGVYLFKDAQGAVLYVGKAKNLRRRVRSYVVPGRDERPQVAFLMKRAAGVEFIVTDTEKEALLLENTLIKKHRPRYNVMLRDDKSYVSIRLGTEHEAPGIGLTRRIREDGARYFGPYDSGFAAREAVEQIVRAFRLRTCSDREFANRVRPCLEYDIGRCTAPCVGRVSRSDYARQVEEVELFLAGRSRELIDRLERRMAEASKAQRYEEAAHLRDAIEMLHGVVERQKVVRHGGGDHDAVGLAIEGEGAAICVLQVRRGSLIGQHRQQLGKALGDPGELLEAFLVQHYRGERRVPKRILLSHAVESSAALAELLAERRGESVRVERPARGAMRRLVELAVTNAREALAHRAARAGVQATLERLGAKLGVGRAPERIECLDISDLSGREAVGSLVAFRDGEPEKEHYRLYTIRSLTTPDDFAMMQEVIRRRFRSDLALDERRARPMRPPPDLLLVDGGKGQLSAVCRALDEAGVELPVAAIAKGRGKGPDRIFLPGRKNPLSLRAGSKELLLLMRIRDEAHRFGIAAHRKKRGKQQVASILADIPGVGPARRKALLDRFGGGAGLKGASVAELAEVPGIPAALARRIHAALKGR